MNQFGVFDAVHKTLLSLVSARGCACVCVCVCVNQFGVFDGVHETLLSLVSVC